jgi:acylphosphatase
MNAKRIVIAGRVQQVGFRQWMVAEAERLGLSGWVRNRADGTVEAVVAGDTAAMEELVRSCRRGPRPARVDRIDEELVEPPEQPGFRQIASV